MSNLKIVDLTVTENLDMTVNDISIEVQKAITGGRADIIYVDEHGKILARVKLGGPDTIVIVRDEQA